MNTLHRAALAGLLAVLANAASAALPQAVHTAPGLLPGVSGTDYTGRQPTFRWNPIGTATWYQLWCEATPSRGTPITYLLGVQIDSFQP